MSGSAGVMGAVPPTSPVVQAVRMFVAPVDRSSGQAVVFDPAVQGRFDASQPLPGWFAMGAVLDLKREAETAFAEVWSGSPALLKTRARAKVSAGVSCTFAGWSKLAMALSSGSQQMNLLRASGAGANDSGGAAVSAVPVLGGSTAMVLQLPTGSAVAVGDAVVVDEDYGGATGYVGSGIAGAYVRSASAIGNDADYVRRVSFNVGRVVSVASASVAATMAVTLSAPLPAGVPTATMKLSALMGFVDRLGGSFVGEWSALFVMDGVQGDRVLLHYPRLQTAPGVAEVTDPLAVGLERWRLRARFHALPETDANDGEAVLCLRSYLPAPGRLL